LINIIQLEILKKCSEKSIFNIMKRLAIYNLKERNIATVESKLLTSIVHSTKRVLML
jgi:hypothetical protein